MIAELSKSNL